MLIIVCGGAMNAVLLYAFVLAVAREFRPWIAAGIITFIATFFAAPVICVIWFLNTAEVDNLVRIVYGGRELGVFIATNENGLRTLSEANGTASGISTHAGRDGLVFIPNKTKGRYKGQKFLLKGGRLVDPYPANSYDMARDGAIEVERIKITEGPHKGLEGWVQTNCLKRVLNLYSL